MPQPRTMTLVIEVDDDTSQNPEALCTCKFEPPIEPDEPSALFSTFMEILRVVPADDTKFK